MIKTYQIQSTRAVYPFKQKSITFTSRGWGYDGATYSTASKEEQNLIESTADYKSGIIICIETAEFEEEKPLAKECVSYDDIYSVNEAAKKIQDVQEERGIEVTKLRSKAAVLAKADELGISFPNLK